MMFIKQLKVGDCFKWDGDYYIVLDDWNGGAIETYKAKGECKQYQFVLTSTAVTLISEKEFMEKENANTRD